MARRPNYGQQRAEINRGKQAKAEAKIKEREEAVARRKAEREQGLPEGALDPARKPSDTAASETAASGTDESAS